jgi:hypothetical protein
MDSGRKRESHRKITMPFFNYPNKCEMIIFYYYTNKVIQGLKAWNKSQAIFTYIYELTVTWMGEKPHS